MKRLNQPPEFVICALSPEQLHGGALTNCDVVIFAGGSASKQAESIGAGGCAAVRHFVENGGGYVGICAGAYLATCGSPRTRLNLINAATISPKWKRGKGQVEIELTEAGKGIISLPAERAGVRYANGPIVKPAGRKELGEYETLAQFRTELAENDSPAGVMVNSPAVFTASFGKGHVACVSPHPEQTSGLDHVVPALVLWASQARATNSLRAADFTEVQKADARRATANSCQ